MRTERIVETVASAFLMLDGAAILTLTVLHVDFNADRLATFGILIIGYIAFGMGLISLILSQVRHR